jgi:hypothetical protein
MPFHYHPENPSDKLGKTRKESTKHIFGKRRNACILGHNTTVYAEKSKSTGKKKTFWK